MDAFIGCGGDYDFYEAVVNAGYNATQTLLGDAKWEIPWRGPDRQELIRIIMETARG